jgi:UDP-glucose 4-epimerase
MLPPAILVTGAGGFIGAMLVNALISKGREVVAVDRDQHRLDRISRGLPSDLLRLAYLDITDPASIVEVARQTQPAAIVHLAAMHVIPHCEAQPHVAVNVNINGLCNVLAAAHQAPVDFVLFASTADVYAPAQRPLAEDDPTSTSSVYGASKLLGERLVAEWAARRAGRQATSVRIFNVYGPGDSNPHVVPDLVEGLRRGGPVPVGNVDARRDFIQVEDVVTLLCRILEMPVPPATINAGTGAATSVAEVLDTLQGLVGRPLPWRRDPARLRTLDRMHLQADTSRTRTLFPGFTPRSLDVGLGDLLASIGMCRSDLRRPVSN